MLLMLVSFRWEDSFSFFFFLFFSFLFFFFFFACVCLVKTSNAKNMADDTIRVCCRFRPVNKREMDEERQMRAAGDLPELLVFDSAGTTVKANDGKGKEESVVLDRIFSGGSTQQSEVYEYVARPTIEDVIRGYNGTIFAYGQTGSGKTWSMFGNESSPELSGIIPPRAGTSSRTYRARTTARCSL